MSLTGTFNIRNDPTSQNTAHLTLISQTVTLSDDDVTVSYSIEKLSSELGEELSKSLQIEMVFMSPGGGTFYEVTTFTDGSTDTYSGTFKQL